MEKVMEKVVVAISRSARQAREGANGVESLCLVRTGDPQAAVAQVMAAEPMAPGVRLTVEVGLTDRAVTDWITRRRATLIHAVTGWQKALHALNLSGAEHAEANAPARERLTGAIRAAFAELAAYRQFESGELAQLNLPRITDPLAGMHLAVVSAGGKKLGCGNGLDGIAHTLRQARDARLVVRTEADCQAGCRCRGAAVIAEDELEDPDALAL